MHSCDNDHKVGRGCKTMYSSAKQASLLLANFRVFCWTTSFLLGPKFIKFFLKKIGSKQI